MASISSETFTVNISQGRSGMIVLYDHSRKYRARKFFLYILPSINNETAIWGAKDFGRGSPIRVPRKMALALWHAHEDWLKTQRSR